MFLVPMTRSSSHLVRHFDRFFDDSFDRWLSGTPSQDALARSPALDVAESEQAYTVTLDLPGVAKDDVKVSIDGRRVSIEARSSKNDERKDSDRLLHRERAESTYSRSFALPAEVDQEGSSAKLDNGVLKLELAKRRVASAAQITVN